MATDPKDLSPPERLTRYREEAADARRWAQQMSLNADRDSFLEMARRWDSLADKLEKSMAATLPDVVLPMAAEVG